MSTDGDHGGELHADKACRKWADDLEYMAGFGNNFSSEAIPGALPEAQNNPLHCSFGLYAEQISGTAFTCPRRLNQRSWLYRIRPSVTHEPFQAREPPHGNILGEFNHGNCSFSPNQMRWKPADLPEAPTDFIDGLYTMCGAGSTFLRHGFAIHMYAANKSMDASAFCNADGDFLIVPQTGRLWITTECGRLQISPGEIIVVPQGFRFSVILPDGPSRGYVAEVFGSHFQLPDLGPIGANGLASPRDFYAPTAWYEGDAHLGFTIVQKFGGDLFTAKQDFSPFNVVAWHGNYVPYKRERRAHVYRLETIMEEDNSYIRLREYAIPNLERYQPSIQRPTITANNFELKIALINMVQWEQFGGGATEDPHAHMAHFLEICDTVKMNGVTKDVVRLRFFPFTLKKRAKVWLTSNSPLSFITWVALSQAFLSKYFAPAKIAKLRNDITSFMQLDVESLYEAWERFKDL